MNNLMTTTASLEAAFYHYPTTEDPIKGSFEPFGYFDTQDQSPARRGAPSALAETNNTYAQGSMSRTGSAYTPNPVTSKFPVYFNPFRGNVGLVCGRENKTRYNILKSLLASSRKDGALQTHNDILCFTAENGSLDIVQTLSALLPQGENGETGQDGVDIIVLAWPSNVTKLRALHASSKNVKVLPLLVPAQEIKLDHLRHICEKQQWGSEHATLDEALQGGHASSGEGMTLASLYPSTTSINGPFSVLSSLNIYLSQRLDSYPRADAAPTEWMKWIQRNSGLTGTQSSVSQNGVIHTSPRLLCVDWTGCTPEEHRIQNVIADIVLAQWQTCSHPGGAQQVGLSTIVCDNSHSYISERDPNPFTRRLSRLSHRPEGQPLGNPNGPAHGLSNTVPTKTIDHSVILLTESPVNIPSRLYDCMDFVVLHRLTSPGWLTSLEKHFHLHSRQASSGKSSPLMDRLMDLDDEHVLLYAPPNPGPASSNVPITNGLAHNGNSNGNINGVIQRPRVQVSPPTPKAIGRYLTKICLSARDHSHPVDIEYDSIHNENSDAIGVIGETQRRNGTDSGPVTRASPPSTVPYYDSYRGGGNQKEVGLTTPSKGGLSPSPSAWRKTDASPNPQSQMTQSWAWKENCTTPGSLPNTHRGFPTVATSLMSPQTATGFKQHSPSPIPFTSLNSADAVVARPIGLARIPSSSSNSAFSFSYSGNGITPSSSVANPSSFSTGLAASPVSPVNPYFGQGRTANFSPFVGPNTMLKTEREGGVFEGIYSASDCSSRYRVGTSPENHTRFPYSNERHTRTDTASTESQDSSSAEYVDIGAGNRTVGDYSRMNGRKSPESRMDTRTPHDPAQGGNKRSYAGVAAREGVTSPQRRDTVVPAPGSLRPMLTTQGDVSSASISGPSSTSDLLSPSSSDQPPPVYPDSFFWPLLDALEKSRAQVSTPHNRAQSVRHSVVGQELPQSARQRLGLTFKEYVAAASRQGVIVTGDSGDKAWIAMKDWKYPGKSFSVWVR